MIKEIKEVLFTKEQIQEKVAELGKELTEYYRGKDLLVVGILNGAAPFMMDLIRKIDLPLAIDFIQVSSYNGTTHQGELVFKKDLNIDVKGKDVLFVDDIIDTGKSAQAIIDLFKTREANSIEFACLLDKKENRIADYNAKFVGFVIPNRFVIGYGLDFDEKFRNLEYIGVLKEEYYC